MSTKNRFQVNLLGISFTLSTNEDEAYLKRILWFLEKKVSEAKKNSPIADPTKIAILTSFYIVDELLNEKSREGREAILPEESEEMERITLDLINDIDETINKI